MISRCVKYLGKCSEMEVNWRLIEKRIAADVRGWQKKGQLPRHVSKCYLDGHRMARGGQRIPLRIFVTKDWILVTDNDRHIHREADL